jgi:hypothetical protein
MNATWLSRILVASASPLVAVRHAAIALGRAAATSAGAEAHDLAALGLVLRQHQRVGHQDVLAQRSRHFSRRDRQCGLELGRQLVVSSAVGDVGGGRGGLMETRHDDVLGHLGQAGLEIGGEVAAIGHVDDTPLSSAE